MTDYHLSYSGPSPITLAARAAKARRKAVLERVWAQRTKTYAKKTGGQWIAAGAIIPRE